MSLFPTIVQLFVIFPYQAKKGVAGLELGLLTPVFTFVGNCHRIYNKIFKVRDLKRDGPMSGQRRPEITIYISFQGTPKCLDWMDSGRPANSLRSDNAGRLPYFILLIIFILFVSGCYDRADVSSPSEYRRENITFLYPDNWEVTQDVDRNDFRYLFVESPGDAIMIIQIYMKEDALSLRDFVEQFAGKTKQEIPLGKTDNNYISTVVKTTATGPKTGLRERFALVIGDTQIPNIREYFRLEMKNKGIFLISQTPEVTSKRVASGFDLILESFALD